MESNWAFYGFLNRSVVFLLLNEETFFLHINNSTLNKIFFKKGQCNIFQYTIAVTILTYIEP